MPQISQKKEDKIKENILTLLFQNSPKALFTAHISEELARDEEYIKKLLENLETKKLIIPIKKNSEGIDYKIRTRWRLSERAYQTYKTLQEGKPLPQQLL
jgi:hypothetical protein